MFAETKIVKGTFESKSQHERIKELNKEAETKIVKGTFESKSQLNNQDNLVTKC